VQDDREPLQHVLWPASLCIFCSFLSKKFEAGDFYATDKNGFHWVGSFYGSYADCDTGTATAPLRLAASEPSHTLLAWSPSPII